MEGGKEVEEEEEEKEEKREGAVGWEGGVLLLWLYHRYDLLQGESWRRDTNLE